MWVLGGVGSEPVTRESGDIGLQPRTTVHRMGSSFLSKVPPCTVAGRRTTVVGTDKGLGVSEEGDNNEEQVESSDRSPGPGDKSMGYWRENDTDTWC